MSLVVEEADETLFWLEMLVGANLLELPQVKDLTREFDELFAIASSPASPPGEG
jgi:hypothetical protein